jgi:NodT family efflux transporter outer membrane factor (OMF) lipoprotein
MSKRGAAVILLLAAAGCSAGPDYKRPALAQADGYPVPETHDIDGQGQRFVTGQAPSRWWRGFASSALDGLVDSALSQSPTLAAADARLGMAKEDLRAEKGGLWPDLSANQDRTLQKYSSVPGAPGTFYDVTTRSVSIAYSFDLTGGQRRAIEARAAGAEFARYERVAARQTLCANVVTTAVDVAGLKEQVEASREIVADQQEVVALVRTQVRAGSAGQAALLAEEARLEARKTALDTLSQNLERQQHRLAVLAGRTPADPVAVDWKLADLTLPRDLPVSLPSDLVGNRPDILAKEALLHQASANVGVAEANMLPHITLNGNYAASVWYLTNALRQPIFAGGSLNARRRSAVDAYQAAGADYRSAVLSAFQNVADVLSALDTDNRLYASSMTGLADARGSLALAEDRFRAGTISRITLLTEKQVFQDARIAALQATSNRYADTVALYQALGGHEW